MNIYCEVEQGLNINSLTYKVNVTFNLKELLRCIIISTRKDILFT